jgi:hypothetical protein
VWKKARSRKETITGIAQERCRTTFRVVELPEIPFIPVVFGQLMGIPEGKITRTIFSLNVSLDRSAVRHG